MKKDEKTNLVICIRDALGIAWSLSDYKKLPVAFGEFHEVESTTTCKCGKSYVSLKTRQSNESHFGKCDCEAAEYIGSTHTLYFKSENFIEFKIPELNRRQRNKNFEEISEIKELFTAIKRVSSIRAGAEKQLLRVRRKILDSESKLEKYLIYQDKRNKSFEKVIEKTRDKITRLEDLKKSLEDLVESINKRKAEYQNAARPRILVLHKIIKQEECTKLFENDMKEIEASIPEIETAVKGVLKSLKNLSDEKNENGKNDQ